MRVQKIVTMIVLSNQDVDIAHHMVFKNRK